MLAVICFPVFFPVLVWALFALSILLKSRGKPIHLLSFLKRQTLHLSFSTFLHCHLLKYRCVGSKITCGGSCCTRGWSWHSAGDLETALAKYTRNSSVPSEPDILLLSVNCVRHQLTVDLFSKD